MNEIPYTSPKDGENCCTVNAQLALVPPTHLASRSQVAMLQRRVQAYRGRGWPTSPLTCIAPLRFHILRLHKSQERDRDRLGSPHPCSGPQRTSHLPAQPGSALGYFPSLCSSVSSHPAPSLASPSPLSALAQAMGRQTQTWTMREAKGWTKLQMGSWNFF